MRLGRFLVEMDRFLPAKIEPAASGFNGIGALLACKKVSLKISSQKFSHYIFSVLYLT
jgi:hypothetical protein